MIGSLRKGIVNGTKIIISKLKLVSDLFLSMFLRLNQ